MILAMGKASESSERKNVELSVAAFKACKRLAQQHELSQKLVASRVLQYVESLPEDEQRRALSGLPASDLAAIRGPLNGSDLVQRIEELEAAVAEVASRSAEKNATKPTNPTAARLAKNLAAQKQRTKESQRQKKAGAG